MVNQHCRRCGDIPETSEAHQIESAGEKISLCAACFEAFKDWFYSGNPDSTPAQLAGQSR